jgi:hypothetical protein
LSSFSVSDISLSSELEDSKILGIKFDSICLTIISPKKSLSHSLHCPLKQSEDIEENGYPLQNRKTAEYVNIDQ